MILFEDIVLSVTTMRSSSCEVSLNEPELAPSKDLNWQRINILGKELLHNKRLESAMGRKTRTNRRRAATHFFYVGANITTLR